jgi:hypothetical protein
MSETLTSFPKVQSPFKREHDTEGNYLATDNIKDDFRWVFERADEVDAVEKIHGTNVAVKISDSHVESLATRLGNRDMQTVDVFGNRKYHYVTRGVQNSLNRGYLDTDKYEDWVYGELVGPKFQGNRYNLDENIFIPFDWLRRKATYRSYGKYSVKYDGISEWFENNIFSLFHSLMHGTQFDEVKVSNGYFVEGVIFVHPDLDGRVRPSDMNINSSDEYESTTNQIAKLRRDMFGWYY